MRQQISRWFRHSPFVMTAVTVGVIGLLGVGASAVWALKIQADPQVIRKVEPLTNTGVNVDGLTLDQWMARGNTPETYRPVPKTIFHPGETMWVLRQDCFVNKVSTGVIFRVFYGGDRRDKNGDLDLTKQSGSQYMLDPLPIPSRSDGCPVKNHRVPLGTDMQLQVWTYGPGVDFYKNPMQTSVRIHFRPVVFEIVAAPGTKVSAPGKP
jgi:hypothetical protein